MVFRGLRTASKVPTITPGVRTTTRNSQVGGPCGAGRWARRVSGTVARPAPSVSAPNATAAPGATRRDHAFAPAKDVIPSRPERTGMSQPYVRTVPGTLPLSPLRNCLAGPELPGEVFLPELGNAADRLPGRRLLGAQLDPADLARDRLGQVGELNPADPLVGRDPLPAERHDRLRQLPRRLPVGGQQHVRLWHGQPEQVWRRDHRRLGYRLVLDQHALQLERRDAVVRCLEDIVGPADVGDVAIGIRGGHVAG